MRSHPDPGWGRAVLRRLMLLALAAAAVLWATAAVWRASFDAGVARLAAGGRADLQLAADRLAAEMMQFREVAVLAADHPLVQTLAAGRPGAAPVVVTQVLQRYADLSGAEALFLADPRGRVLAGPPEATPSLTDAPELARAVQGAVGAGHGVDPATGRRLFTYAAPVFAPEGPVIGVVVLRFDAERVEAPGRGNPVPVWFTDDEGVVFVSNRSEMVFETDRGAHPDPRRYPPDTALHPPQTRAVRMAGVDLVGGPEYLPDLSLAVTQEMPVIGMTGHALADVAGVLRAARMQALSVALALSGFAAVIAALWERRRALASRLAAEAGANAVLEERVAERTAALQAANEQLTRTQAELVQAGKMSALGQMSAGISHELNQPLMAIRSYAENAGLLLERDRIKDASQNLEKISEMSHRMGRIIRNLRAFARAESEPATRVGLASVVEAALELLHGRIARAEVAIDWQRPAEPAIVMGGEVRLSQVVVNLISNAIDALEGAALKRITIRIAQAGDRVRLTIRDTGPGIVEPARIFDPFYSTKEVGSAEGMGLGLSISYGLVQGFGGVLSGENAPEGGALFTVDLRAAPMPGQAEEAAE